METVTKIIADLQGLAADARAAFEDLNAAQLNWKQNPESWSVGQCLEHLIKTDREFFPELDKLAAGARRNSFWENWSPLTGWAGGFLIKSLKSDERKFKVPTPRIAPPSSVAPDIVTQYVKHLEQVTAKISATQKADLRQTVVTSPFMKLMTYTLGDGYAVIVEHARRHLRQAGRVMQAEGFPQ